MNPRIAAGLGVAGLLVATLGIGPCPPAPAPGLYQKNVSRPGILEPHTPGAPGVPVSQKLVDLLGPDVDLNRVSYVRTYLVPPMTPTRVILILIPGFLGGATTFDPLARDLVEAGQGRIEVWAVDRRPNQFEDQLGARHAKDGVEGGNPAALFEGAQFYFADTDVSPEGDFPGPGDLDVNLDGDFDDQVPLEDPFGVERSPVLFEQDDLRFAAWWGIDLYMRDWKLLVDRARLIVGQDGLVVIGGHSQGTTWSSTFTAYDFDPGPGVVAGHDLVDGLILIEGGGVRPAPCSGTPPPADAAAYLADIAALEAPGGGEVFLENLVLGGQPVLKLTDLGTLGQVAALAGFYDPTAPSLIQRSPIFFGSQIGLLLSAPSTNQTVAGLFLDDDFSPNPAFRAGMGFSDNGRNIFSAQFGNIYIANAAPGGALRTWKRFDDPTLPTCPPHLRNENNLNTVPFPQRIGCAIDTGGVPGDREVSDVDTFLRTQFEVNNGFEWYFIAGRVSMDFRFCNDSSALGDESLLAITQNASMDKPVLGIGGGNGLAPSLNSFNTYFNSIATPAGDKRAFILPGYAHVDPIIADQNESVPLILDFVDQIDAGASPIFP